MCSPVWLIPGHLPAAALGMHLETAGDDFDLSSFLFLYIQRFSIFSLTVHWQWIPTTLLSNLKIIQSFLCMQKQPSSWKLKHLGFLRHLQSYVLWLSKGQNYFSQLNGVEEEEQKICKISCALFLWVSLKTRLWACELF